MKAQFRLSSFIALAAGAVALTGCFDPKQHGGSSASGGAAAAAAGKTVKVNQPFSGTSDAQPGGTVTELDPNTYQVQDQPYSGTFAASLPKKITVQTGSDPDKTFRVKALNGKHYAVVDGITRSNGSGEWTGVQLIRFAKRKLGLACIAFSSTTTNNNNATGTFRVSGGTKAMKRIRFSGTFTQRAEGQAVVGQITGSIKLNKKRRGLPADCRALVPKV